MTIRNDQGRGGSFDNPPDPMLTEIRDQVREIWSLLNGKDGKLGINAKVSVMWRMHGWLILGIGTVLGVVIEKWVK